MSNNCAIYKLILINFFQNKQWKYLSLNRRDVSVVITYVKFWCTNKNVKI